MQQRLTRKIVEYCAVCSNSKRKRILLPCHHDVCLKCAVNSYFKKNEKNDFKSLRNVYPPTRPAAFCCELCPISIDISPLDWQELKEYFQAKYVSGYMETANAKNYTPVRSNSNTARQAPQMFETVHPKGEDEKIINQYGTYLKTTKRDDVEKMLISTHNKVVGEFQTTSMQKMRKSVSNSNINYVGGGATLGKISNQSSNKAIQGRAQSWIERIVLKKTNIDNNSLTYSREIPSIQCKIRPESRCELIRTNQFAEDMSSGMSSGDSKQISTPCKCHPEEELIYYCFTCSEMLCSQCSLYGQHSAHNIHTFKKALVMLNQSLDKEKTYVDMLLTEALSARNVIKEDFERIKNLIGGEKAKLQKGFEEFLLEVHSKYNQLLKSVEFKESKVYEDRKKAISVYTEKINTYNNLMQNIQGFVEIQKNYLTLGSCDKLRSTRSTSFSENQALFTIKTSTRPSYPPEEDKMEYITKVAPKSFQFFEQQFRSISSNVEQIKKTLAKENQEKQLMKLISKVESPHPSSSNRSPPNKSPSHPSPSAGKSPSQQCQWMEEQLLLSSCKSEEQEHGLFSLTPSFIKCKSEEQEHGLFSLTPSFIKSQLQSDTTSIFQTGKKILSDMVQEGSILFDMKKTEHERERIEVPMSEKTIDVMRQIASLVRQVSLQFQVLD